MGRSNLNVHPGSEVEPYASDLAARRLDRLCAMATASSSTFTTDAGTCTFSPLAQLATPRAFAAAFAKWNSVVPSDHYLREHQALVDGAERSRRYAISWLPSYTVRLAADLEVELCDIIARGNGTTRFATVLVEVL